MRLTGPQDTGWTGVLISESGEILTTSELLGEAPVVDVRFWDGSDDQACVTGRDDDVGLALLGPLTGPARTYDYLALSGESPSAGQQLDIFQYSSSTSALERRATTVVEDETLADGFSRIAATDETTADGAVLVDAGGAMQGMRMPILWLLRNDMAGSGEVIAVDASAVANVALPALRSGRMHALPASTSPDIDTIPLLPIVFHGEIGIDGTPAAIGTLVHAKVSKEREPDRWHLIRTGTVGEYVFPVAVDSLNYVGATVEFWTDCRRSPTTALYEEPLARAVELGLAF